ncbi:MAG TPA: MATE family efflux transporter [Gammaproteobacteria bacterium]|nr:MATE family efflux transporter [Gammaproteobacteria bacterium]
MNATDFESPFERLLTATRNLRSVVADSLSGRQREYTSGSVGRSVLLLAIPMVLEMAMESVFVVVDIFFVARLGPEAVATVGLTEAVLTLLYAVAIGLSMAVTALVARRIGAGDGAAARVVAAQTVWVGAVCSLVIAVAGVTWAADILRLMGAEEAVVRDGQHYTAIMLGGSASILYLFLLSALFRGAGDAVVAMRSLWLANGINIALDPCLIFGIGPFPELGVTGAAVATTIGRGVAVLYLFHRLASGRFRVSFVFSDSAINTGVLLRLLRVSVGGVLQFLIATSSYLFLMRIMATYGSVAVAGFTIGIRIFAFTFLPAWGLGNAAATLVGQNLGNGNPDRAERSVWYTAAYNTAFLLTVAIVFLMFSESLARIFTSDTAVVAVAAECLRVVSYGYVFYAVGLIVTQAFNGAGDTATPTWINLFCFWLLQIPLAWALAASIGPTGVFAAIAIAESVLAIVSVIVFRTGRWKRAAV